MLVEITLNANDVANNTNPNDVLVVGSVNFIMRNWPVGGGSTTLIPVDNSGNSCLGQLTLTTVNMNNQINISTQANAGQTLQQILGTCDTDDNGDFILASFVIPNVVEGECFEIFDLGTAFVTIGGVCLLTPTPNVVFCYNPESQTSLIEGSILYRCSHGDDNVEGIAVEITDTDGNVVCSTVTGPTGEYQCEVEACQEYHVNVIEECEETCGNNGGITMYDLILTYHTAVLGVDVGVSDDIHLFAMDMNGDGKIDEDDIECLRNQAMYLGCDLDTWCKFVPHNLTHWLTQTWDTEPKIVPMETDDYSSTTTISAIPNHTHNASFMMYSLGDIDCSCGIEYLDFNLTDNPVSITAIPDRNGEYEVKMNTSKNLELFGVEFDLPSNAVEITDFESNNDMDWSYNTTPDGQLRIIGINTTGTTQAVAANTAVFSFKLNQSVTNLELSNNEANNVLMDDDGLIAAIQQSTGGSRSNFNVELTQTITQCDALFVQLSAKMEETVNISVFDIFGRTIYQNNQDLNEGINDFNLPISTPEGIYILSVFDGERYQSEKIYWTK